MLGAAILCLKAIRAMMFQLSGFYCRSIGFRVSGATAGGSLQGSSRLGRIRHNML